MLAGHSGRLEQKPTRTLTSHKTCALSQDDAVTHYNEELMRLADELGRFEGSEAGGDGGGLTPSGNAVLLLDAIAAELGLLAPLAVSSGFCDVASLGTNDAFRFFVRQVCRRVMLGHLSDT